jgi:outer membrane protein assembly factor BamB
MKTDLSTFRSALLLRSFLLTCCISIFFLNDANAQALNRKTLSLPAGEMWGEVKHRVTPDGGTISLFETFDNTSQYFLHVVKTSAGGSIQWTNRWLCEGPTTFSGIGFTPDSGFIFCYIDPAPSKLYFVLRLDHTGAVVYSKSIDVQAPYSVGDMPPQVITKANGHCYIVGVVRDLSVAFPYAHFTHVMELNANGTVVWSHAYNAENDGNKSQRVDADTCSNGDLVIMSFHVGVNSIFSPQLLRLTPTGAVVWSKHYSLAGISNSPSSMVVTPGDEIVVASESNSVTTLFNVMRCDGQGNVLWNYEYTSSSSSHIAVGNGELMEAQNSVVLWGFTPGAGLMVRIDFTGAVVCQSYYQHLVMRSSGDLLGNQRYSVVAPNLTAAHYVYFTTDLCGQTCNNTNFTVTRAPLDATVASLTSDTLMPVTDSAVVIDLLPVALAFTEECSDYVGQEEILSAQTAVYPVPANDQLSVTSAARMTAIEIINVNGAIVCSQAVNTTACTVSTATLADGIYMVRITGESGVHTHQLVIAH